MKNEHMVSVVIPVYNGERYIEETIINVFFQTYDNIEIICINDGSTDGTASILDRYADKITVVHKNNGGVSSARNCGLSLAVGTYVLFLDCDDRPKSDYLRQAVASIRSTGSGAVVVDGELIDAHGNKLRNMYRFRKPDLSLEAMSLHSRIITTSQVLFDRRAIVRAGGFDEHPQAVRSQDWEIYLRFIQSGEEMTFLEKNLLSYRIHAGNQSKDVDKVLRCELYIIDKHFHADSYSNRLKSFRYLYYAYRKAKHCFDPGTCVESLARALRLNGWMLFSPRFFAYTSFVLLQWLKQKKEVIREG